MVQVQGTTSAPVLLKEAVGFAVLDKAITQQSDLAMELIKLSAEQIMQMQQDAGLGNQIDLLV